MTELRRKVRQLLLELTSYAAALKNPHLCSKAGYTATLVACGWAVVVLEKVTRASGQELYAHKAQNAEKVNSRKSVRWSAVPVAPM